MGGPQDTSGCQEESGGNPLSHLHINLHIVEPLYSGHLPKNEWIYGKSLIAKPLSIYLCIIKLRTIVLYILYTTSNAKVQLL